VASGGGGGIDRGERRWCAGGGVDDAVARCPVVDQERKKDGKKKMQVVLDRAHKAVGACSASVRYCNALRKEAPGLGGENGRIRDTPI
jgi:hypothetical protein